MSSPLQCHPRQHLRQALTLTLFLMSMAFAGCGVSTSVHTPAVTAVTAHGGGSVHGGQQPVVGSQVYLYAVANTQNGPAASLLDGAGFVLTDSSGNFNITGHYTCPAGAYVYLLALGGNPGLTATNNPQIALAAGLGACSSLSTNSYFTVNEVTTVAFAYALSPYATSATNIGSPSSLAATFADLASLVDPASGTALSGTSTTSIPQAKINSLANSIAACVNSSGTGAPCSTLNTAATPTTGNVPADTFQSVLNVSHQPNTNVAAIYDLASANMVFSPALSVAPTDWAIAPVHTDGCLVADSNTYLFSTSMGNIYVELRPDTAPKNVANFLAYTNAGLYNGTFIHRSVPSFILQAGGYIFTPTGNVVTIPTYAPVVNEFNLSNVRGTLAMATLSGNPNSATSQFFFNTQDNSSILDTQNGGSTVFGQIVSVQGYSPSCDGKVVGLAVIDAISTVPVYNLGSPFDSIPLVNYDPSNGAVTRANLVTINSIAQVTNTATTVATPTFTPDSNNYLATNTVSLSDSTPGAVIYYGITYTAGGSSPYVPYTGPITIGTSETIYAYATAPGYANASVVNTATYTPLP